MPLIYKTGTFTTADSLLEALHTFLVTDNAWTMVENEVTGSGRELLANNGTIYANLRSFPTGENRYSAAGDSPNGGNYTGTSVAAGTSIVALNCSTAQADTTDQWLWETQTGAPTNYNAKRLASEIRIAATAGNTYHFFCKTSPHAVYVWIEDGTGSGLYRWMAFGQLDKYGTYTGGEFFGASTVSGAANNPNSVLGNASVSATESSTFYRVNSVDGFGPGWLGYYQTGVTNTDPDQNKLKGAFGSIGFKGINFTTDIYKVPTLLGYFNDIATPQRIGLQIASRSTITGQTVLLPMRAYCKRLDPAGTGPGDYSPLGQFPHIFYCRMENQTPGAQITVGAATYRTFPFRIKASGTANADYDGVAIRTN